MYRAETGNSPAVEGQPTQDKARLLELRVVSVPSGVATGRTRHLRGNAHLEWWTLFSSHEQYDACAEQDPLRFAEPIRFAWLNREVNNVFDQLRPGDIDSGALASR